MGNSSSNSESPKAILERGCGWVSDKERVSCFHCEKAFSFLTVRRHHCRLCGEVFCDDVECWGGKLMLPHHLFVDEDPLAGSSAPADANLHAFLKAPQSVCCVCHGVLNSPLKKIALTLPETAFNRVTALNRALWADSQYRKNAPEHVIHVTVASVGQKTEGSHTMYNVNRRYRLHLDSWRPFTKQTRLLFCAVDATGDEEPPSPSEGNTPRSRSGSVSSTASPTNQGVSAMRRARRKSRTDLVLDLPTSGEAAQATLPNRWTLGGTAIFNCDHVSEPTEAIRLETYSDIIVLSTDDTVAPHFTLTNAELYQAIKQMITFSRVRGKVRVSSVKVPSSKLLKKSKS